MRILMLTNSYVDRTRGGVELHVFNLARELEGSGHQVTVGRTTPGPSLFDVEGPELWVIDADSAGTEGRTRGNRGKATLQFMSNFVTRIRIGYATGRRLRSESTSLVSRFDVIHHHDFITSAVIARLIRRNGIRQVWTNHLGEFLIVRRLPLVGKLVTRWLTSPFRAATGPSRELADQSAVKCPIQYVPNGVDVSAFTPIDVGDRRELRARLGIPVDGLICIVPRRWAPSKGVVFAAEALSLPEWPEDVSVLFVGAGESDFPEYAAEVRRRLASARHDATIIDSVDASQMADYLRASDICVIPSVLEATSLSALEAMASGLPIVASDVGGLPEIVNERTGVLVPTRSAVALAEAVSLIASMSQTDRDAMSRDARDFVVKSYAWSNVSSRISEMYGWDVE